MSSLQTHHQCGPYPFSSMVPRHWLSALVASLLLAMCLPAQAQRVALLVGNANYQVGKLTNPPNDVAAMEGALKAVGFKVQKVLNANQNQMKRAVRDFGTAAQGADVAFVYFSGHGTQVNGENYLLPVGATIEKESDYAIEAIAANDVLAQIRGAQPKAAILVLDACRDNPLAATTKSTTKGLGRMSAPTGTMIAFATSPGDTASDNGHYARVLAKELQRPGQELVDVFRNTAAEVRRLSAGGKQQDPRISEMSINERIYLASVAPVPDPDYRPGRQPTQADPEEEAWQAAKAANSAAAYDAYLADYPRGKFASAARIARAAVAPGRVNTNTASTTSGQQAAQAGIAQAAPVQPEQTLEGIRAAADPGMALTLSLSQQRLSISRGDKLDFTVSSPQAGYLYLFHIGSDGKTFDVLFPNDIDNNNFVTAGTHRFPRPNWALQATGPEGTGYVMAYMSIAPKNFRDSMGKLGPFSSAAVNSENAYKLGVVAVGGGQGGGGRFGASAVVPVVEVR